LEGAELVEEVGRPRWNRAPLIALMAARDGGRRRFMGVRKPRKRRRMLEKEIVGREIVPPLVTWLFVPDPPRPGDTDPLHDWVAQLQVFFCPDAANPGGTHASNVPSRRIAMERWRFI